MHMFRGRWCYPTYVNKCLNCMITIITLYSTLTLVLSGICNPAKIALKFHETFVCLAPTGSGSLSTQRCLRQHKSDILSYLIVNYFTLISISMMFVQRSHWQWVIIACINGLSEKRQAISQANGDRLESCLGSHGPILLTWFNFNPSMNK